MSYQPGCWHCTHPRAWWSCVGLLVLLIAVPGRFSMALLLAVLAVPVLAANTQPQLVLMSARRQTRKAGRIAEHERRVGVAPTGRAQAAAAFDRWRSAAVRHPDAAEELNAMATHLNETARRLEASTP